MKLKTHVMLDLETVSCRPNAGILSVGACKFNSEDILERFYVEVKLSSCYELGLTSDKSTLDWWKKQSSQAREVFNEGGSYSLAYSLGIFSQWFGDSSLCIWGNGAGMDNVILKNAFQVTDIKVPWEYWDDRCYRTVKACFHVKEEPRKGVFHNALDDALHQANHLIEINKRTKGWILK